MGQPSNAERQFLDLGKEPYPFKLSGGDPLDPPLLPKRRTILAAVGIEFILDNDRIFAGTSSLYRITPDQTKDRIANTAIFAARAEMAARSVAQPLPKVLRTFMNQAIPDTLANEMGPEISHLGGGVLIHEQDDQVGWSFFHSSSLIAGLRRQAHALVDGARNGKKPPQFSGDQLNEISRRHLQVNQPRALKDVLIGSVENLIASRFPDEVALQRGLNERRAMIGLGGQTQQSKDDDSASTERRRQAS